MSTTSELLHAALSRIARKEAELLAFIQSVIEQKGEEDLCVDLKLQEQSRQIVLRRENLSTVATQFSTDVAIFEDPGNENLIEICVELRLQYFGLLAEYSLAVPLAEFLQQKEAARLSKSCLEEVSAQLERLSLLFEEEILPLCPEATTEESIQP